MIVVMIIYENLTPTPECWPDQGILDIVKQTDDIALAVGGYLMMCGAINPETGVAYGLNDEGEVDLLGVSPETKRNIGRQAMGIVSLCIFIANKSGNSCEALTTLRDTADKDHTQYLAQATEMMATQWGVDKAIERLSAEDGPLGNSRLYRGKTIQQRLDEFNYKYQQKDPINLTEDTIQQICDELHEILGRADDQDPKSGNQSDRPRKISGGEDHETLLHTQTFGRAQCVVFSTLALETLRKFGIPAMYALSPGHQYVAIPIPQTNEHYYYEGTDFVNFYTPYERTIHSKSFISNPSLYNNYANLLTRTGRLEEAERHYLRALELDSENLAAHSNYAISLDNTGRSEEAERHYLRVLELDEDNTDVRNNYANLLTRTGRLEEAERHYLRVLELDEDNTDVRNNYSALLALRGLFDESIKQFAKAGYNYTVKELMTTSRKIALDINKNIESMNAKLPHDMRRPLINVPRRRSPMILRRRK